MSSNHALNHPRTVATTSRTRCTRACTRPKTPIPLRSVPTCWRRVRQHGFRFTSFVTSTPVITLKTKTQFDNSCIRQKNPNEFCKDFYVYY